MARRVDRLRETTLRVVVRILVDAALFILALIGLWWLFTMVTFGGC